MLKFRFYRIPRTPPQTPKINWVPNNIHQTKCKKNWTGFLMNIGHKMIFNLIILCVHRWEKTSSLKHWSQNLKRSSHGKTGTCSLHCSQPLEPLLLLSSPSVISDSLRPHGLQHTSPPYPSTISWSFLTSSTCHFQLEKTRNDLILQKGGKLFHRSLLVTLLVYLSHRN